MVAFRIAQPVAVSAQDAGPALDRLLADTRHGPVSTIVMPGQCLVRMLRGHERPERVECVMTWEPLTAGGCSFLGSLMLMKCGKGSLALVLDGLVEVHDPAQLQDDRLARECAAATGRAVLERISSSLSAHNRLSAAPSRRLTAHPAHHLMSNVS